MSGIAGLIAGGAMGMMQGALNNEMQLDNFDINSRKQIQFNKWNNANNVESQVDLWNKTGYEAQVEQMKKAGINPGLLYGKGGGGGQTAAANTPGVNTPATNPNMDIVGGAGMGIQLGLMDAQRKNIEAQTAKLEAETPNITQNTKLQWQQTHKQQMDNLIQEISQATDKDGNNTEGDIQKSAAVTAMRQQIEETARRIEMIQQSKETAQEQEEKINKEKQLLQNQINWEALNLKEENIGKFMQNIIKMILR